MRFDYLTLDEVLAIHANQIEIYGGAHGIRDLGALEAAVARPKSGYYPDLIAEAAALWGKPGSKPPVYRRKQTSRLRLHGDSFVSTMLASSPVSQQRLPLFSTSTKPAHSASRNLNPGCATTWFCSKNKLSAP